MPLSDIEKFRTAGAYAEKLSRGWNCNMRNFHAEVEKQHDLKNIEQIATETLDLYTKAVEKHYNEKVLPGLSNERAIQCYENCKNRVISRAGEQIRYALSNVKIITPSNQNDKWSLDLKSEENMVALNM